MFFLYFNSLHFTLFFGLPTGFRWDDVCKTDDVEQGRALILESPHFMNVSASPHRVLAVFTAKWEMRMMIISFSSSGYGSPNVIGWRTAQHKYGWCFAISMSQPRAYLTRLRVEDGKERKGKERKGGERILLIRALLPVTMPCTYLEQTQRIIACYC